MSNQPQCPTRRSDGGEMCQAPQVGTESDIQFIDRQFRASVQALERVGALDPGEFDRLAQTPVRSEEDRRQRSTQHASIARRALAAVQDGSLREEDFNIWSGRRKENGEPVKHRFESAYTELCSPALSCKRGTLTGIVRTYQHILDELLKDLQALAEGAVTVDELLAVERRAVECSLLEFELYTGGSVAGWPVFPRSAGRFRGAVVLREVCERRQAELPMDEHTASALLTELTPQNGAEKQPETNAAPDAMASGIKRVFAGMSRLLRRTP